MFLDDIKPVFTLIDRWEKDGFRRSREDASPLAEVALVLWNLGGWMEDTKPAPFELPDRGFPLFIAQVYQECWAQVEAVAEIDANRSLTGGCLKSGDLILTVIECALAVIKCLQDGRERAAWSYAIDARHLASTILQGWDMRRRVKTALAVEHSEIRWASDPKQAAKAEARNLWNERHAGKHPRLRTNEQFAIECMRRWPVLTSASVICGWCTAWTKAAKGRKTQSAS